ncbi:MAG TPA: DUF4375 domain-containing protein [Verrucomicrobiales bacterium]|nr:DUF4375 domain-containing protein [Verrucomicrobiales bacterium]
MNDPRPSRRQLQSLIRAGSLAAVACALSACGESTEPSARSQPSSSSPAPPFHPPDKPAPPIPDNLLPFDHPAAQRAHGLFMALSVKSEEDYRSLPLRARCLLDIMGFETEVMNGGIHQYLWNGTGDHALQCLEALEAVGAVNAHALLRGACALFPDHHPSADTPARRNQMTRLTGEGKSIDDLMPQDKEIEFELYALLLKYWDAHGPEK